MKEHGDRLPACIVCGQGATMESPADLCDAHWDAWFDCKIEIGADRITWREMREGEEP